MEVVCVWHSDENSVKVNPLEGRKTENRVKSM